MPNIITKNMKIHMAEQFVESITEAANTIYYVTAGKSTSFDLDTDPPSPQNSVYETSYKLYDEMIFGKHIKNSDVSYMIKYKLWEYGSTYDMYDDKDPELYNKYFYVVSKEPSGLYSVFKCLNNGKLIKDAETYVPPVTDQPLSSETYAGDSFYKTADGYVWKLMYVITRNQFAKFATSEYVPVYIDENISNAAIDGSIETVLVESPGTLYNAYAYGTIKQAAVSGNTRVFSLQTDDSYDILTFDADVTGTFLEKHTDNSRKKFFFELSTGEIWSKNTNSPIFAYYYYVNGSTIRVLMENGIRYNTLIVKIFQTDDNTSSGNIIASGDIESIRRDLVPVLSSNADFYANSNFYIRYGTGAGNLRKIVNYIVTGSERRVVLDEPFPILPDSSSRFEIGPRVDIIGDGSGLDGTGSAKAIAIIEESSNSIHSIEIIDTGKNYTYATAIITSNTGYLNANTGDYISANSAQARVIISPKGGHGKNSIKELGGNYVCITSEFDSNSNDSIPSQNDYRTISLLKNPTFNKVVLEISDNAILFNDGEIVTQISGGSYGEVYNREGNTLTLKNVYGYFFSGEEITTIRGSNEITSNIINLNKTYDVVDQRLKCAINISNMGSNGSGFLLDEMVTHSDTGATGYINSISTNRIDLVEVKGVWSSSDVSSGYLAEMIGETSKAIAKISGIEDGDFTKNSGEFIYVENFSPVYRSDDQKEQIKIIMEF